MSTGPMGSNPAQMNTENELMEHGEETLKGVVRTWRSWGASSSSRDRCSKAPQWGKPTPGLRGVQKGHTDSFRVSLVTRMKEEEGTG